MRLFVKTGLLLRNKIPPSSELKKEKSCPAYPSFVGMTKQPLPFDKLRVNSGMTKQPFLWEDDSSKKPCHPEAKRGV